MISLKDYAAQRNITYEAVRKSVTRYKEELEGHIVVTDRTQYLDDEAVAFLDERRKKNPVVIIQQDKDEKIQRLEEEVDVLKSKVIMLYERIDEKDKEIKKLEQKNQELLIAGSAQPVPGQGCQDELVIDAEPAHGEEVAIDAEPVDLPADEPVAQTAAPEPGKLRFKERLKLAAKILKGE